jgi:metal iron transporter
MNCPSRPEPEGPDFNQNPSSLAADLTTRQDLNGIVNSRILRRMVENEIENVGGGDPDGANGGEEGKKEAVTERVVEVLGHVTELATRDADGSGDESGGGGGRWVSVSMKCLLKAREMVVKFGTFVGPGFMVCSPPLSLYNILKTSLR